MIAQSRFTVEPWHVREVGIDLEQLAQSESIFALSNGHIGVRGNFDEGDPSGLPGTYLNSFFETRPLPYAEAGYGYPESGQSIVNVTNGKLIRLLVDDEPFDLRYGTLLHHERILDLRSGLLRRVVEWASPSGRVIKIRSTRLVSFTQRAVLAVDYEVEAVDVATRVVLQSELVANEHLPAQSADPRVASALEHPLRSLEYHAQEGRGRLIHQTRNSGLRMAIAVDHVVRGLDEVTWHTDATEDWTRMTVGTLLPAGQRLGLTKFVTYGWSAQRSVPALRDQVDGALSAVLYTGWDGLVADQREYVQNFFAGADVEVDGDPAVQQAVRFGLFHILQSGARAEQRALPAKGLSGPGYDGHAFWDSESYVLPVLVATAPEAAADALRWRMSTLDLAVDRARTLTLGGAAFPWRTIDGHECSAYWPAGTAAFHVNAAIAAAATRQVYWTGDEEFERLCALPLLVQTARLWDVLGYHGSDGRFHLDGVTGPDEYSAIVDDNTYTNLMVAQNLRSAATIAEHCPDEAAELGVNGEEIARWRRAADCMAVPFDDERKVHQSYRGSTTREVWDFKATAESDGYPLLLHAPYFDLYRKQVIKQADLVLALHWCGDRFSLEEKTAAFEYCEPLTVRDSSLSACSQAIVAAETGHLQLAHDYLSEAAFMDLRDLESNTGDGLHIASLAGSWLALVCGFGGMRDHEGKLTFAPRLSPAMTRLSFGVRWRGQLVRVEVGENEASYTLSTVDDGPADALTLTHHGEAFSLGCGSTVTLPLPPAPERTARPSHPAGRSPSASALPR